MAAEDVGCKGEMSMRRPRQRGDAAGPATPCASQESESNPPG